VTVTFHAVWMLCAVGSIVFAAVAARQVWPAAALLAGFAIAAVLVDPVRLPDSVTVGVLTAAAALVYLCRPRYRFFGAMCGGALSGVWVGLSEVQGIPKYSALAVVGLVLASTMWLSRSRPRFAPEAVRDEALLVVLTIASAVTVLPGVLDGWRSAAVLTAQTDDRAMTSIPLWTMVLVGSSLALGGLHALWSRR
jgi:hypothetical protein